MAVFRVERTRDYAALCIPYRFRHERPQRTTDIEGADILPSWLVNGHADLIDVIDVIKEFQRTEGVALHLRIFFSGNKNAEAVFEINDPERAVRDDDAVGGRLVYSVVTVTSVRATLHAG